MITISLLSECSAVIAQELGALAGELSQIPRSISEKQLERIVADQNILVMVVRDDEKIIGMASVYIMPQIGKMSAQIEDVVVSGSYRGQGLGERLMREVIHVAKEKGISSLSLTSRSSRVAANKLYQKLGFAVRETNAYKLSL